MKIKGFKQLMPVDGTRVLTQVLLEGDISPKVFVALNTMYRNETPVCVLRKDFNGVTEALYLAESREDIERQAKYDALMELADTAPFITTKEQAKWLAEKYKKPEPVVAIDDVLRKINRADSEAQILDIMSQTLKQRGVKL